MADGREKRKADDLRGAAIAFQRAHELMNVPTTALELARTLIQLGELELAWRVTHQGMQIPMQSKEPSPFAVARTELERLLDELDKRIPTITLHIQGLDSGQTPLVRLDNVALSPAEWIAPLRVNAGSHQIFVSVEPRFEKRWPVSIKEAENVILTIETKPPETPARKARMSLSPPITAYARWTRPAPLVAFTIAGVGLLAGGLSGLLAFNKASEAKQDCLGNRCPESTHDAIHAGRTWAAVSTVSFAIAAVGATAGSFIATWPSTQGNKPGSTTSKIVPWISTGSTGLAGEF